MVFSSIPFLFFLFAIVLFLYFTFKNPAWRNALLLVASLLFYAWGEPVYILLLVFSVFVNWLCAILITKYETRAKLFVSLGVLINIALLVLFKYSAFLVENFNLIFSLAIPVPHIRLPIGISFFTFQALSYVIDVYRDKSILQKSFPKLLLYVSFFPQLIAGPIVKYHDIASQLEVREHSIDRFVSGMKLFLFGLAKKVIVSNTLAKAVDTAFADTPSKLSSPVLWIVALSYVLQIYYDFSGYSDMARGLGRIFGFDFLENFNYPYSALGIKDFWRRWHISLSTWFREYLYIPLGGNRRGKARALTNQLIVFCATGLWHGANITFLFWGVYHGLFLVLESSNIIPTKKISKNFVGKAFLNIYTWVVVLFGLVLFRSDTLSYAITYVKAMFVPTGALSGFSMFDPFFSFIFVFAILFSYPVTKMLEKRISPSIYKAVSYAFSVVLLVLCMMSLASDTYNPFIYFRF